MYDLLFDNRLDVMLQKASSQDLTDSISEAEKAIKEHNELKVCNIVWFCLYLHWACEWTNLPEFLAIIPVVKICILTTKTVLLCYDLQGLM